MSEFKAGDIIMADDVPSCVWSEPTPALRWNSGVLEQQHVVYGYSRIGAVATAKEWHPVPQVDAP